MGKCVYLLFIYKTWVLINQEKLMLGVSSEFTEDSNCGPIWVTKREILVQNGRSHSLKLPMLPVSLLKRLVSNANSPTPVSESVLESNSRRITKESPPTFLGMVV